MIINLFYPMLQLESHFLPIYQIFRLHSELEHMNVRRDLQHHKVPSAPLRYL